MFLRQFVRLGHPWWQHDAHVGQLGHLLVHALVLLGQVVVQLIPFVQLGLCVQVVCLIGWMLILAQR